MHRSIVAISLFLPLWASPQTIKKDLSFYSVDSFSRTVRYKKDIYRLTKELTEPYGEQILKTRAIFIWITDNIGYNYRFVNKGKETTLPECTTPANCEQVFLEWENTYLKKVIKRRTAVCDGYARLFKKMCDIAGISCEIISGYTKTKPYQVGQMGSVNHAWNAVHIDSNYYFLDPTWAAGACIEDEETGKLLLFFKNYNDYYWLTPVDDLFRDHYPRDIKWVLHPAFTKEKYADNPYYASNIISDIRLLSPSSGVITAKVGDTLHFKFSYKKNITYLQVNSNVFRNPSIWEEEKKSWWHRKTWKLDTLALKRQQYIPFKRDWENYAFDYVVTDNSLYYLEVLFDRNKVMKFNIKIEGKE